MKEEQVQLGSLEAVQMEEFLLNLLIMPAAGLERSTPACLSQHSYRKKFKLMISCSTNQTKYCTFQCAVISSLLMNDTFLQC